MKHKTVAMRNIVLLSTLGVLMACAVPTRVIGDSIQLSFDSLFQTSPYKGVLDLCMQLYGELDVLCQAQDVADVSTTEQVLISDAMLGKAVRLQTAVNNLLSGNHPVSLDNIEYLVALLERMEQRSSDLQFNDDANDDAHETILANLLGGIRSKLEEVLE